MTPPRVAVLDDYQQVAMTSADWAPLQRQAGVASYDHLLTGADLTEALQDKQIVVIMRERAPFPADLFDRLPKLKLLVTTGMRNASVDLAAAATHGVTVCGTDSGSAPAAELTWALILGLQRQLATPHLGYVSADNYRGYYGEALADIAARLDEAPIRVPR